MMKLKTVLYSFIFLVLAEIFLRLGFSVFMSVSFVHPSEIIYHYYPMIRDIRKQYEAKSNSSKVLILSCSTLHKEWGGFREILQKKLNESRGPESYQILNAAGIGFSSSDNLNCYKLLSDLKFDIVIDYSGINDSRFNNCPPDVYKEDYSHLAWNNEINCILRHHEMDYIVTPFILDFAYQFFYERIFPNRFIPIHYSMRPTWWSYGSQFKSLSSFKNNLLSIRDLAAKRKEQIIFIPYCFYLPADYSLERFKEKKLDYRFAPNSRETEIWGRPDNVSGFLNSSNQIVTSVASFDSAAYLDIRSMMKKPSYYADICHFSPEGLSLFSDLIAEKIESEKKPK